MKFSHFSPNSHFSQYTGLKARKIALEYKFSSILPSLALPVGAFAFAGLYSPIPKSRSKYPGGWQWVGLIQDSSPKPLYNAAQMRVQLKCTSSLTQYKDNGDSYTYTLKVKNYNDLIRPATTPIILGLLILPADETIWLEWTEEELRIKGCMYWADFSGFTESTNSHSIDVRIDKKNVLNSSTIVRILEDSAREDCS